MNLTCKHCAAPLSADPEKIAGEVVIRCSACDSLNVIALTLSVLGLL